MKGFVDKLYWRQVGAKWHCFKRERLETLFTSLCGWFEIQRSGGQAITRPEPNVRCGRCDGLEMERRDWK